MQTDTYLLKIYKRQALLEVSVSFSMSLWRKIEPNRHLREAQNSRIERPRETPGIQIPRACAGK